MSSDEVLVFLRQSSEERPLKIYIFRAVADDYQLTARIDGSGTSIHSILYSDMDSDGIQELIISWSVSAEVQAVGVYALESPEPVQLMSTPYARYEVVDLDGDGRQELVVLRSDDAETGGSLADYYDWDNGSLQLQSTARLSTTVAALQWAYVGTLQSGERAVFVTGRVTGADETPQAITDILVCRQSVLENIVLSDDTGVSTQIFRASSLQPADINGDGATEVPAPAELRTGNEDEVYWKIYWYGYSIDGTGQAKVLTYHNLTDNWYMLIPDRWDGHFTVRQSNTSATVHSTTFYAFDGLSAGSELFTIYTLTGTDRESQAAKGGRVILRRRTSPDAVYAISYSAAYDEWNRMVPREMVESSFQPIITQWSMGEN